MPEKVVKTEVIANDKDGTLEKVYFEKQHRTSVNHETGLEETKQVQPWEIRATGRKTQELKGAFKDSGPEMMHEGWKEWNSIGETKITRPDGSVDTVRADKEEMYRNQPGFCETATRPTFNVDGFGGMKRLGLTRLKIRFHNGEREVLEAK